MMKHGIRLVAVGTLRRLRRRRERSVPRRRHAHNTGMTVILAVSYAPFFTCGRSRAWARHVFAAP